jgi:hypothetical protein
MTLNTIENGQLAPEDAEEHQVQVNSGSQAVAVKALPTNAGVVWVGEKEKGNADEGWPLSAGEQITLDLKGANLYYTCENAADKLAWMVLAA